MACSAFVALKKEKKQKNKFLFKNLFIYEFSYTNFTLSCYNTTIKKIKVLYIKNSNKLVIISVFILQVE